MQPLDRMLQQWRMRVAAPWIPDGARILDIGCHRGEFLNYLGPRIVDSVGIDPLAPELNTDNYRLIASKLEDYTGFETNSFDVVVLLATLEHIRNVDEVAFECARLLKPQGRVVLTVPNPIVDQLLRALKRFGLLEGMSIEEHQGLNPNTLPDLFNKASFSMQTRRGFQFGLNNLFVFEVA